MSDQPLVSVILPFHDSPYLSTAIDSILSQTHTHLELILVDNNGTAEDMRIVKSYAQDMRIRVIHEPRQGVVHAMNAGIVHAIGNYIARMDSDDYSYPDRIKNQLEVFKAQPEVAVVSGLVTFEGPEESVGFSVYIDWINSIQTEEEIRLNQFVEFPMVNPSLMFRKNVFDEYGFFAEGQFPEDYEFFLRLQQNKVKMIKATSNVLRWRDSERRLTRVDPRYSVDAFFKIKAKYLSNWLMHNNPNHPNVFIWGAGRLSKKRSNYLKIHGVVVEGYIDVKSKDGVIHYEDIASYSNGFVVSFVSNRGARNQIKSYLINHGFQEEKQFILAS